jgi:uncharacterized protein
MKNALVTGASSGIGLEIATQLSSSGYKVYLIGRDSDRLQKLSSEINGEYLSLDMSEINSAQKIYDWLNEKSVTPDFLVNNAGIGYYGELTTTSFETYQGMIQLNSTSLVQLTYLFLPEMLKLNRPCQILNISSIAAYLPTSEFSVYSATKAFVKNFSESLAQEISSTLVSVTHVAPGGTKTAFMDRAGQEVSTKANLFMMEASDVAKSAISYAQRASYVGVPGIMNLIQTLLPRLLPTRLAVWMTTLAFSKFVKSRDR